MGLSEAIMIISLIISTILTVDQAAGQAMANNRNSQIAKDAKTVYNEVAQDRNLVNQLLDAYNRRDMALANQLLISSPFGSRVRILRNKYKENQRKIADTQTKLGEIDVKQTDISSQINEKQNQSQTSGSAIVDLISGAAKDPTTEPIKYEGTGITSSTIEEVNYGQKK